MDKAAFKARRSIKDKTETVDLGGGDKVIVRGLTRDEIFEATHGMMDVNKLKSKADVEEAAEKLDRKLVENRMIQMALIDPSDMTVEDVAEWLADAPASDAIKVTQAIERLSGVNKEQSKSDLLDV